MEKRKFNIILIIVGILIIIGISYAYFTSDFTIENNPSSITVTTATIDDVKLTVEGKLVFDDLNILPGHKNISSIKVTALSEKNVVEYNLVWKGTNELNTPLNYYVYKSNEEITPAPSISCIKTQSGNANFRKYFEECTENNFEKLGEKIYEGTINTSTDETKVVLSDNQVLKGSQEGHSVYYYVVLEFPNITEGDSANQNIDINKTFDGVVTVEETESKLADITINKIYTLDKNGEKTEVEKAPEKDEGYTLDKEQSSCQKGNLDWDDTNYALKVSTNETGTLCDLYFKKKPTAEDTLENLGLSSKVNNTDDGCPAEVNPTINSAYTGKGLLCKGQDDEGATYYFRGAVTNNWLNIGNTYWRIIRINGDGTIRLIYNGTSTNATGADANYGSNIVFNSSLNNNAFVGLKYTIGVRNGLTESSNMYNTLKSFYENNFNSGKPLASYASKLDYNAGFCGDRTSTTNEYATSTDNSGGTGTTTTYYGGYLRLNNSKKPIFTCPEPTTDLYTLGSATSGNHKLNYPVGLITMDEIMYAGGGNSVNNSYWLYTGVDYWTMSPSFFSFSSPTNASVHFMRSDGIIYYDRVDKTYGVRPVINLKADTKFSTTTENKKGTTEDPYVVEGAE